MKEIISIIGFLVIETVLLWDFTLQLAGLNEDLSNNNCKWRKRTVKHLKNFFPTKDSRRSFKKVKPEYLYTIIFCLQIALYVLFLISLINSIICYSLFLIGVNFKIMYYWIAFTVIYMLICCIILSIAYYLIHKECKSL